MTVTILAADPTAPRTHADDVCLFAALGERHVFQTRQGRRLEGYLIGWDGASVEFMSGGPCGGDEAWRIAIDDVLLEGSSYFDAARRAWVDFRPVDWIPVAAAADDDDEEAIELCLAASGIAVAFTRQLGSRAWVVPGRAEAARAALRAG
ncbi:MAG: hypothetical protein Q8S73_36615 [Deltaproteobacteria bacterium]|nr:hypothetical protein [Myxococcales bacterium]MDP3219683.1 hypothetical protein [Deltaproteobacteria bacterium]